MRFPPPNLPPSPLRPFLWLNQPTSLAAQFYTSLFPSTQVWPLGPQRYLLNLEGIWLEIEEGGNPTALNPSLFFRLQSSDLGQVHAYWDRLCEGGKIIQPLGQDSDRQVSGWCQDSLGLTWQIRWGSKEGGPRCLPCYQFCQSRTGAAAMAMDLYEDVLGSSAWEKVDRYAMDAPSSLAGRIAYARLFHQGVRLGFMDRDASPSGDFTPAGSLVLRCRNQSEIDYYWHRLRHGGMAHAGGWVQDAYGLYWHIIPYNLEALLPAEQPFYQHPRLKNMTKIDWAQL